MSRALLATGAVILLTILTVVVVIFAINWTEGGGIDGPTESTEEVTSASGEATGQEATYNTQEVQEETLIDTGGLRIPT